MLPYLVEREAPLGRWAGGLLARAHKNVVVVALANKLARIAWAVLARGRIYEAEAAAYERWPAHVDQQRRRFAEACLW